VHRLVARLTTLTLVASALVAAGAGSAFALAPDAPAQPTVAAGNAQIGVTFSAPASDGGSPITGYGAACSSSDGGSPGSNTDIASPITVTGLTNGKTYVCTVTATNADGDSPASSPSDAVIPSTVPDAPGQPSIADGDAQITLTFGTPASDGGSPITGYTGTCTSTDGGAAGTNTDVASPITVTGLTNGKTYICTVTATNAAGDGPASLPSAPSIPSTVPDAPPQPTVVVGAAQITVTFGAPASDGGFPIIGFTVACSSSDGGTPGTNKGFASPITVTGLTIGKTYTCTVAATNFNGDGPASSPSDPAALTSAPNAPSRPSVVARNAEILVSFHAPANGGSSISGYRARCASSNGGVAKTALRSASPIRVRGLTNGKLYTCRVAATNANGTGPYSSASSAVIPFTRGFRLFSGDGGVFAFGEAAYYGSAVGAAHTRVITMAPTPDNRGYWLAAVDGSVYAFGNAHWYGSAAHHTRLPLVGMAATPTGKGYWLVASDGGIFTYGDAHYYGSTGGIRLRKPIVGMATTPTGRGYWLAASDGGLFSFGDAHFYGSAVHRSLAPIVGMARSSSGHGYWITDAVGHVFDFGDAPALGSTHSTLRLPMMGITTTPTGRGYWLAAGDGSVFVFGDAPFYGWTRALYLRKIIRGISR
jgi:hypothetical protein